MAYITKRGEGRYLVRVFLGRDTKGKQRFKNKTIRGRRKDAERWARDQETALDLGQSAEIDGRTLKQCINDWLDTKRGAVTDRTLDDYSSVLRTHLLELGAREITKLKHKDLTDIFDGLRRQGFSPRLQRRVHLVLNAAFKLAHVRGHLRQNPMAEIKAPKNERQLTIHFFTPQQAQAFLAAAIGTKYEAMWYLALETGLRPEEYYALRWQDLDLARGELYVRRALIYNYNGTWEFSDKLKTKRSRRTVPISPTLVERLRQHQAKLRVRQTELGEAWQDLDLVFPNEIGAPLNQNNTRNRFFRPLLEKARLDIATRPYDLRHTCASLLLDAGVNVKVVSERLGHSSVAFTLDVYAHVMPHNQAEATVAMSNILLNNVQRNVQQQDEKDEKDAV